MKIISQLTMCEMIRYIFYVFLFSLLMTFFLASAVIVLTRYPVGFEELFNYLRNEPSSLITGSAVVFSGICVIVGVFITIRSQQDKDEDERKRKIDAIISRLPSAFIEISRICKNNTLVILGKSDKVGSHESHLSETSANAIDLLISHSRADEWEEYCKILHCYRIVIMKLEKFKQRIPISDERNLTCIERKLIVDLVSLQSIAEIHAYSFFYNKVDFSMELCKMQFVHNMHRYNKVRGEIGDPIEGIEKEFKLNLNGSLEFGDSYIGFLNDDYVRTIYDE